MGSYAIRDLKPKHRQMLLMALAGADQNAIAEHFGYTKSAVSCIMRSPIARAEIARMQQAAVGQIVELPQRVVMQQQLNEAAQESVKLNRAIMRDPHVRPETRSRIASHFMDRVIFQDDGTGQGGSYREILKKLDALKNNENKGGYKELLHQTSPSEVSPSVVVHNDENQQSDRGDVAVLQDLPVGQVKSLDWLLNTPEASNNDIEEKPPVVDPLEMLENGIKIFDLGDDE